MEIRCERNHRIDTDGAARRIIGGTIDAHVTCQSKFESDVWDDEKCSLNAARGEFMNPPILIHFMPLLALLFAGSSGHILGQERHLSLVELAQKAETFFRKQSVAHIDYYIIEISRDKSRLAKKDGEWFHVWARTDSVVPRFAALVMSSNGNMREMEPPTVMQALAKKQSKPQLSLVEALKIAETYAKRLSGSDRLQTAYLITLEGGSQRWHILSRHLSLFVFMDGTVQETGDL